MLRLVYVILVLANLFLFLMTHRKISYLLIYYLSSCLYYVSAIIGSSFVSSNNHISGFFSNVPVNSKTYIIMIINMLFIMIFLLLELKNNGILLDNKDKNNSYYTSIEKISEKYAVKILIFINFIVAILFVLPSMKSLVSNTFNKADLLEESSSFVSYFKSISSFIFVYLFTQKNINYGKIDYFFSIVFIFITVLLGHRSYLVISLLGIVIYKMNSKKNTETLFVILKRNWKRVAFVFLLFILFIVSKNIYTPLLNGNYELVLSRLKDPSYYINSFKQNEFNTIFVNLDTIVKYNFSFPITNYVRAILIFIPFLNRFITIEKFSMVYQKILFNSNIRASTFLGEAYACGNFIFVILIVILILSLLNFFDKRITKSKSDIVRTFFILSAVDFSFYIHRNSLEIAFSRIRFFVYIIIIVGLMKMFLKRMVKQ